MMIEVKANLSFRDRGVDWRPGQYRQVDDENPVIAALLDTGYLTRVDSLKQSVDPEGAAEPVEPKKLPSTRKSRKKVTDGDSESEPDRSDSRSASQSDSAGDKGVAADAGGS